MGGSSGSCLFLFRMEVEDNRYSVILSAANRQRTIAAYRAVSERWEHALLIKGWALARHWDRIRDYSDVDVVLPPGSFLRAPLNSLDVLGATVDLHYGLRSYDTLPWSDILNHSYIVDLDGVPIRVLADEDNLRVTAVHWLTDGGVNKERLWDIYYLVKNRKADFDWERCLESNGPIRKTWVMAAIATARDHLDLDVSGLPEEAQNFQLPAWYKKTLSKEWERGPYIRRVMATVITKPKLLIEQLQRRFPPNPIAATIDTETPIDNSSRIPAQLKSLTNKVGPFARGLGRRLTYKRQKHDR